MINLESEVAMNKKIFLLALISLSILMVPAREASAKIEPIAQAYEVQGSVMVKRAAGGEDIKVKKGFLFSSEDMLTLKKGASLGLYFKDGGKAEIKAEWQPLSCKVVDLMPEREPYDKIVATFGATRGIDISNIGISDQAFFYPQEIIVINSPPLVEVTVFDGTADGLNIPRAVIQFSENDTLLYSKNLSDVTADSLYTYACGKLGAGKEYGMEIRLEITGIPETIAFTTDFYVADTPHADSISEYGSFEDAAHRSFESTSIKVEDKAYKLWVIKRLGFKENKTQPVISIEIFIKEI